MGKDWLKGLNKENDCRVLQISKTLREYKNSDEFHKKYWEVIRCPICEHLFERRKKSNKPICCSVKCSYIYRGRKRMTGTDRLAICLQCGKEFNYYCVPSQDGRQYCSRECAYQSEVRNNRIGNSQKGIPKQDWVISKYRKAQIKFWASLSKEQKAIKINAGIGSAKARENCKKRNLGRKCPNNKYKRGFFRKDLNQYFRSSWEANFARIMNFVGIKWEYEKERFVFNDSTSMLIDFFLSDVNVYVEVKGFLDPTSLDRLEKLSVEYAGEDIKIVDGEAYGQLEKTFSSLIPNWEYKNRTKFLQVCQYIK